MFTVEEILRSTGGSLINGDPLTHISGISIDSRTIEPGELFLAIKGRNFDGHGFVEHALRKGAVGVIFRKQASRHLSKGCLKQTLLIQVQDTVRALGDLAFWHRKRFAIPIIGITGSNGKTTTKDMVASILTQTYITLRSEESFNNFIGVPLTLFKLTAHHQIGVLELGTSQFGEIKRLSQISQPTFGLITNVGPSHLEFFGSLDGVYKAKAELLGVLGSKGVAILNGDDRSLTELARHQEMRVITFGMNDACDFRASQITYEADGLSFLLNDRCPIELKLLGRHNVYNALASIAVTSAVGLDYDLTREALLSFRPPRSRMEVKEADGIKIIDDTYNSNPQSLGYALETLSRLPSRRKILVSGDMLELGASAESAHYQMGQKVAEAGIDLLATVGGLSKEMSRGALGYGMKETRVFAFDSHEELNRWLLNLVNKGDIILIKGSRAMKMEKVVECLLNNRC